MEDAIQESVNVPNQELVVGDFLKFGDYQGGFTKVSMAFAIPATCENPEAAATLINYLLMILKALSFAVWSGECPYLKQGQTM